MSFHKIPVLSEATARVICPDTILCPCLGSLKFSHILSCTLMIPWGNCSWAWLCNCLRVLQLGGSKIYIGNPMWSSPTPMPFLAALGCFPELQLNKVSWKSMLPLQHTYIIHRLAFRGYSEYAWVSWPVWITVSWGNEMSWVKKKKTRN